MSDEETQVAINEEAYNCPICLCDVSRVDVFTLKQCDCSFCRACLSEFLRINIEERTIHRLRCPNNHIRDFALQRDEIKKLATNEQFLSYIRQKHEDVILKDPNRIFCPRSDCSAVCYSKRLGPRPVRCMTCGFKFCRLCLKVWPGPSHSCSEELNLMAMPEEFVTDDDSSKVGTDATTKTVVAESKRQCLEIKRCPRCGVAIQKAVGCPQMRCLRCGHSFCWSCMKTLDHANYLQHMMQGTCPAEILTPQNESRLRRCCSQLSTIGLICCCGLVCMASIPVLMLFSPCLVLCPPPVPQIFVPEEYIEPFSSPNFLNAGVNAEDTDSERDDVAKPEA